MSAGFPGSQERDIKTIPSGILYVEVDAKTGKFKSKIDETTAWDIADNRGACFSHGFARIDTRWPTNYFRAWVNPDKLTFLYYWVNEGKLRMFTAKDSAAFASQLRKVTSHFEDLGGFFLGITTLDTELQARFRNLGLGDLLH